MTNFNLGLSLAKGLEARTSVKLNLSHLPCAHVTFAWIVLHCFLAAMMSTEMLCCWLKILYYIALISYHACDVAFDWGNYFELSHSYGTNRSFSGYEQPLFCFSCAFGSLISLGMIVVYGCYITFHGQCIYRGCLGYKLLTSCNRRFNDFELLFSILELLGKDAIQSYLLYCFYKSQSDILEEPTCYFLVFALCSLVSYSKLSTCFITKLCGCGVGEESCCKPSKYKSDPCANSKVIACFIGLMTSGLCLFLTIVSMTDGFQAPAHIFTSVAECFYTAKTN